MCKENYEDLVETEMNYHSEMPEEETHSLLEPATPAFSNVTVRRAFVVWMYSGQRNSFKDVCTYYHHLEAMEEKLSPEQRAASRQHEYDLFTNQPPTSPFLMDHYPNLYAKAFIERPQTSAAEPTADKYDFKLEDLTELTPKNGVTTQEIVETSRLIRMYCRTQTIELKDFLHEFKQHAKKCDLKYTVNNVAFYIKRKMVHAEIKLETHYPKTLGFLSAKSANDLRTEPLNNGTSHGNIINDNIANNANPYVNGAGSTFMQNFNGFNVGESSKMNCSGASGSGNSLYKLKSRSMREAFEGVYPQIIDNTNNGGPVGNELFQNGKSTSKQDLSDEDFDLSVPKERRFSGSFEKTQLVKFRKI